MSFLFGSNRYNRNGWLGVKHQVTYLSAWNAVTKGPFCLERIVIKCPFCLVRPQYNRNGWLGVKHQVTCIPFCLERNYQRSFLLGTQLSKVLSAWNAVTKGPFYTLDPFKPWCSDSVLISISFGDHNFFHVGHSSVRSVKISNTFPQQVLRTNRIQLPNRKAFTQCYRWLWHGIQTKQSTRTFPAQAK